MSVGTQEDCYGTPGVSRDAKPEQIPKVYRRPSEYLKVPINFAAVRDSVESEHLGMVIRPQEDSVVPHAVLVDALQARRWVPKRLRDQFRMRRKVVDLFHNPAGDREVELVEVPLEATGGYDRVRTAHFRQTVLRAVWKEQSRNSAGRPGQWRNEGSTCPLPRGREVAFELFPRTRFAGQLLLPRFAEPAHEGGVVKDKKIFESVVPFVKRFPGPKPLVIQFDRNFNRRAHIQLPSLSYRRFGRGATEQAASPWAEE